MADYILLAKPERDIYPEEFSSPHKQRIMESLDELLEDPIQCEAIERAAQPIQRSIYKKSIRKIDRDNPLYSSLPNMRELWSIIDRYAEKQNRTWREQRLYISLLQQQYAILESVRPQFPNSAIQNLDKYYLNLYSILNLSQAEQMAKFLLFFIELSDYCTNIYTDLYTLLTEVKQAIAATHLSPIHYDILLLYIAHVDLNSSILYLQNKYGKKYSPSHLSVTFYAQICPKIAFEFAEIHNSALYKNDPSKWRICISCKQRKLLSKHNFHRYSNKPGGYSLYCIDCANARKQKEVYGQNNL